MRRDMDLIREMLKAASESFESVDASRFVTDCRSRTVVGYHVALLGESGLARVSVKPADNDPYYVARIDGLTWDGHEYLDAISSDSVWRRVKRELSEVGGGATTDVVKAVAVSLVLKNLGVG